MNREQMLDLPQYFNSKHHNIWVLFEHKLVYADKNGKKYSIFKKLREV